MGAVDDVQYTEHSQSGGHLEGNQLQPHDQLLAHGAADKYSRPRTLHNAPYWVWVDWPCRIWEEKIL